MMKPFPTKIDSLDEFKRVFEDVDYVLVDCDGVLFLVNTVIPGADTFMAGIKKLDKKVIYATNNSSKSRRLILDKLHELGFDASENEVMVTSYAAAVYLKKLNFKKKVFVAGSAGLAEECVFISLKLFLLFNLIFSYLD